MQDLNLLKNLSPEMQDLLDQFLQFLPKFFAALVILLVGWIVARLLARVIRRILVRIKVDRLMDSLNEIDMISKSNIKLLPSVILSKTVYYIIMLIAVIVTVEILGVRALSDLITNFLGFLPDVFAALVVFIVGLLISNGIRKLIITSGTSLGIPSAKLIGNFLFYFLFIHILMMALKQIGVETDFFTQNVTVILAGAVLAFALGYGISSRDLMANYLASFYSKGKFAEGDVIQFDDVKGQIISKDSTSVKVKTGEETVVILPLSILLKNKVQIFVKKEGES